MNNSDAGFCRPLQYASQILSGRYSAQVVAIQMLTMSYYSMRKVAPDILPDIKACLQVPGDSERLHRK